MEDRKPASIVVLALGLAVLGGACKAAGHSVDFKHAITRSAPAVVNIQAYAESSGIPDDDVHNALPDFFDRFLPDRDTDEPPYWRAISSGSGFIVDSSGLIVTNHHVVAGAEEVIVRTADRRDLSARIVGSDLATDIALLRVDASQLPAVAVGDSTQLAVGDWVIAIGSPFNFDNTVTAGIVSAKGRSFATQQYVPFIQTDVPINRGNSGGPLLNLDGEVVGINSQIFSENGTYMGLSFTIPIEIAMSVVNQLRSTGSVSRGLLGVGIEDVTQQMASVLGLPAPAGAIVTIVSPNSAAENAGIQPWDVIVALNGETIETFSDLPPKVGLIPPGDKAMLDVVRDGKLWQIEVTVGALPPPRSASLADTPGDDLTEELPKSLGLELRTLDDGSGVEVVDLSDRRLWRRGIRPGDVILSVNRQPVESAEEFTRLAEETVGNLVLLLRQGQNRTFVVLEKG